MDLLFVIVLKIDIYVRIKAKQLLKLQFLETYLIRIS
jgi:hypothetical protein